MTWAAGVLVPLLRAELTAVNQQFTHMLALRLWQEEEMLARLTRIDNVDFANAMKIVALLVARGESIRLAPSVFRPGSDVASILRAEREMEREMEAVLDVDAGGDGEVQDCIARAAEPRAAYRDWLDARLATAGAPGEAIETDAALAAFLGLLIGLVEQAMLHAFLLHEAGDTTGADNAWRLSGAAMLYGTAIVRRGALEGQVPGPKGAPAVEMAEGAEAAFDADMALLRQCAEAGRRAAGAEGDTAMGRICLRIAEDCELIPGMERNGAFPGTFGRDPVFEDFAASRARALG